MDRESVAFRSNCIHSKNIFSLADLPQEDETFLKIKNHIDTCRVCSSRYAQFNTQVEAMRMYIPKPIIDRESKEVFEREIHDLFKVLNLNPSAAAKARLKQKLKSVDVIGASFISHLTSKTMLKAYAFAGFTYLTLKYFF